MDVNLIPLPISPLFITNYVLNIESMISKLYKLKETDSGSKISNVGGWQNSQQLNQFKEFLPLTNFIKNLVKENLNKSVSFKDTGMWGNISSTTHYNTIHKHSNPIKWLSGVYYLQVFPDSGNITFYDDLFLNNLEYTPVVGDLLIFPGSSPHAVKPNNNSKDRVSIAFNFQITDLI